MGRHACRHCEHYWRNFPVRRVETEWLGRRPCRSQRPSRTMQRSETMGRKKVAGLLTRSDVWHIDPHIGGRRVCANTGAVHIADPERSLAAVMGAARQAQNCGSDPLAHSKRCGEVRAGKPAQTQSRTFGRRLRAAGDSCEDWQDLLGHRSARITTHDSAAECRASSRQHPLVCADKRKDRSRWSFSAR